MHISQKKLLWLIFISVNLKLKEHHNDLIHSFRIRQYWVSLRRNGPLQGLNDLASVRNDFKCSHLRVEANSFWIGTTWDAFSSEICARNFYFLVSVTVSRRRETTWVNAVDCRHDPNRVTRSWKGDVHIWLLPRAACIATAAVSLREGGSGILE